MDIDRLAGKIMFGAALAAGFEHEPVVKIQTPAAARLVHGHAESEKPANPVPVHFDLNRQMRRVFGGPTFHESSVSAPEGMQADDLRTTLDGLYQAVRHRDISTHRADQFDLRA